MFNKLVTVFDSSCTQEKFVMVHVPGHASARNFKSCTVIISWLRDSLYRDPPAGGAKVPSRVLGTVLAPCNIY